MPPQETKTLFTTDNTVKLVTSFGSAIIFLSILKAYVFYASFGIRITNYITFSEAILLFLDEIAVLILYFLLIFSLFTLIYYAVSFKNNQYKLIDVLVPSVNSSWIHKLLCLAVFLYPLFYLFYAIVINALHYSHFKLFVFFLISFFFIELMLLLLTISWWKKLVNKKYEMQNKIFGYIFIACIAFFYTWSLDRQLFLFHINKINKTVVAYSKDNTTFLTNRDVQFLGSTGKFIFCYNNKEERAVIIDAAKFDRVEYGTYHHLPGFSIFDLLFH